MKTLSTPSEFRGKIWNTERTKSAAEINEVAKTIMIFSQNFTFIGNSLENDASTGTIRIGNNKKYKAKVIFYEHTAKISYSINKEEENIYLIAESLQDNWTDFLLKMIIIFVLIIVLLFK